MTAIDSAHTLHPLFERLLQSCQASLVTSEGLDAFLSDSEASVPVIVFVGGDIVRYPEVLDVAVILPELCIEFPGDYRIALVHADSENEIAKRYAVRTRPTLLFLRGNKYVTSISGVLDWDVFCERFKEALHAPTQAIPIVLHPV